jgi:TatD DNase family protein
MQLVDSHSHIDFSEFDEDREMAIKRASNVGISNIIVSATTAERWSLIKALCDKQIQCHPAYGLHPMFMDEHKSQHLDNLKHWIEKEKPIAIGEIGLDYFIDEANGTDGTQNRQSQLGLFISQLEIANEFSLPVIIHARKSQDIVLKQLRQFPNLIGSIHSFSGSEQQAKQLIDLGFYLGFGGPITYTRATRLRKLVSTLPLESLLLETDSPDQPDALHFKQRNEPAYLINVAQVVAELRDIEVEEVARSTTKNARTLFSI